MHTKDIAIITNDKSINLNNIKGYNIEIFSNIDEIKSNYIDLIIIDSVIGYIKTCDLISKVKYFNKKMINLLL